MRTISTLRRELRRLLDAPEARRTPSIRRSRLDGWMYATDVLVLTDGQDREKLLSGLSSAGWEIREEGGWINLRKALSEPPRDWYDGVFGPEAACCLSLLKRHPESMREPSAETVSLLVRAAEEGPEAYETACREIHGRLAERLRKGQPFPNLSEAFFRKDPPTADRNDREE